MRTMLSSTSRGWCDQYVPGDGPTVWRNMYSLELRTDYRTVISATIIKSKFVRYATVADVNKVFFKNAWQGDYVGQVDIDAPA